MKTKQEKKEEACEEYEKIQAKAYEELCSKCGRDEPNEKCKACRRELK